jgi:broad specificity phosphatase PhoE
MSITLAMVLMLCSTFVLANCSTTVTSVYLLRHAEKMAGQNPGLTPAGQQRAQELARVLKNVPLTAVYSTNTNRTIQTVQPLAGVKNLMVSIYTDASVVSNIMADHEKRTVVVVGHSNTVPGLIEAFGGSAPFPAIPGAQFDNLFLLIVKKEKRFGSASTRNAKVLHMKYGAVSP